MSDIPPPRSASRLPALDIARGGALLAMIIYHTGWDLSALGLAGAALRQNPLWLLFGHLIAASFLLMAGVSLHLAHGIALQRAPFLKRLAMVAGAAALVSAATWFVFPQQFIFFGILHAIAAGTLLALPLLRAPLALVVALAGLTFVLPSLVQSAAFSSPWLVWLGLGSSVPPTQDFVPLFPWFGFILLGLIFARVVDVSRFAGPRPTRQPAKLASLAGRHSLAVYLVHQPLIYGALWLVAQASSPVMDKDTQDFLGSCRAECSSNGGTPDVCMKICVCAAESLKSETLWSEVIANRITPTLQERFAGISRVCAQKVRTTP